MKALLTCLLLILLFSCSFNKLFLQPDVIPLMAKKGTLINPITGDTTVINISGDNFQPTFTNDSGELIILDYTIESVVFQNSLKTNLNGWFLKSIDTLAPAYTMLFLHGNGGNITTEYPVATPFLKEGFQVFIFDYSGYGFSQGEASRENILIDATSALDYILSRPDVKATKLVIYGQSLGGHLASVLATQRQSDIDILVIEGAFSSYRDIGAHSVPIIGRVFVKQGYSAKKSIKSFNKPLLVIHSTEDSVIPFYMGQKIFDAANEPKEFYEIKKCHACGPIYYSDSISAKIKFILRTK